MRNFGEFGQVMTLIDMANQAQYNAANVLISKKQLKGEQKLSEKELQQQERLAQLDIAFKYKEMEKKEQQTQRRNQLFKDIALYAGIGIGVLAILITLGVMFVSTKRESQFEYLIEEVK